MAGVLAMMEGVAMDVVVVFSCQTGIKLSFRLCCDGVLVVKFVCQPISLNFPYHHAWYWAVVAKCKTRLFQPYKTVNCKLIGPVTTKQCFLCLMSG